MMPTGTVTSYDPEKGEGYVRPDGQDEELPFEVESDDASQDRPFRKGDHVSYEVEGGMAGIMAIEVRPITSTSPE